MEGVDPRPITREQAREYLRQRLTNVSRSTTRQILPSRCLFRIKGIEDPKILLSTVCTVKSGAGTPEVLVRTHRSAGIDPLVIVGRNGKMPLDGHAERPPCEFGKTEGGEGGGGRGRDFPIPLKSLPILCWYFWGVYSLHTTYVCHHSQHAYSVSCTGKAPASQTHPALRPPPPARQTSCPPSP